MAQESLVTFHWHDESVSLSEACILDQNDFEGIHIATSRLSKDFGAVTGSELKTVYCNESTVFPDRSSCIIVGSLLCSSLIQNLVHDGKLAVDDIEEKWESFAMTVVDLPLPGVRKALVIAGSDKRSTIYGIYSLSEHIGVSPWYWWADVVPEKKSEIFIRRGRLQYGEPSVKYRGIFINDEAPSLTGWVLEKFGPKYNVKFYEKLFELLLRLKANFLWPAMWPGYPNSGNSFFVDDELNQKTAHAWGIAVSTSHHEPMQRAMAEWFAENPEGSWTWTKNKEKIQRYFRDGAARAKDYESYITLGMRGDGDRAMTVDDPPAVLREILTYQRSVINDVLGMELLALYKEVQEYFENGLSVPDDVTLLFADDNFGNIRRLPVGVEADRAGRAGVSIKKSIPGLPYAWDINSVPANNFMSFFQGFADQTISSSVSDETARLLYEADRLISLRKHEHIEANTFSILNYGEAEGIVNTWESLLDKATELNSKLTPEQQPAFFQLVLHHIKASYIYTKLRVTQAKNCLFGLQRRNETNKMAQQVLELFDADFDLAQEYHSLLDGKWNHMLRQPHYGYRDTWHAPSRDMIDGLGYIQVKQGSNPIVRHMGLSVKGTQGIRPGLTNEESDRTHPSRGDLVPGLTLPPLEPYGTQVRFFEIYRRGTASFTWCVSSPHDWVKVAPSSGRLDNDTNDARVHVGIDWPNVPAHFNQVIQITISSSAGDYEHVHLPVIHRDVPDKSFCGFVESDNCVSIPATEFSHMQNTNRSRGLVPHPLSLILFFTMALDINPKEPLVYEAMIDDISFGTLRLIEDPAKVGDLPPRWDEAVQDYVWKRTLLVPDSLYRGRHVIKVRFSQQNVLLEKIVLDLGGVRESYLGPLKSTLVGKTGNFSIEVSTCTLGFP
ncbi:conserved hypothetical protein [Talaromyces stipitatus ATCC 10500]|uniref:Gylcosyl hydrolase 115 C-terminal domain-containing protein n=1 Tax=Talaromyces stipitatus (strain ATCC 10500 / CBS 375.48 / QM 6759 / NRRL 1006) TaxID=441959 RepID=B8MLN7_TALSN|nr:uncharacterized protein TSTA_101400 [Talaromyces stipitatus ATCC 10500]EED13900.1 conserved hypothetical protein [Talaromyces stipitatus ATCC 10500]